MTESTTTILEFTIAQLQQRYASGELTAREVTQAYLDRIKEVDGKVKAYLTVDEEGAYKQADVIDAKLAAGDDIGLLGGIPIALKDLLCTKGLKTTASSNILKEYVPPHDATAVAKLREHGAIILGKTNLDAFAHGSSTETSDFGPSHNPHDLRRHPGGSSGGSAAAVSALECVAAIGTETSGSIRQPSGLTGIVGIKPTYGRVSRFGVISMASSLDCVGPMARTVEDAALILQVMAGKDDKDATGVIPPLGNIVHALAEWRAEGVSLAGMRLGIPKEGWLGRLPENMEKPLQEAVKELEKLGATVKEVSIPSAKVADAVYAILCPSEVSSNLSRYDGIHYGTSAETSWPEEVETLEDVYMVSRGNGLGTEAKRRVMTGTYALSAGYYDAYYKRAAQVRTKIIREMDQVFQEVDLLLGSSAPAIADIIGAAANDPTYGYTADDFVTYASSLAGMPAVSVPAGFAEVEDGPAMPVGIQFMAPQLEELRMLKAAEAFETATQNAEWRARLADPLAN
ncbi:MAG: Asp-tRNA(Asn)/Glu-tRNA(Gln) amidotransferase subunit GatA [Candidatus Andersenbacteria bacterium]|nr:Asp-tRNA(Asn)/Glu-tRNA(Gln) amidotransferase subunit GatA [Candidatus Andersenbacteria bacterium]